MKEKKQKLIKVGIAGLRFGSLVHVPAFKSIKDVEHLEDQYNMAITT